MDNNIEYATKIEVLEKIRELYSDIQRITYQIDFNGDEYEQIVAQREKLFGEILILQEQKDTLPLGAGAEQISECEQKIKFLIMSILADTSPILEKSINLRDSMEKELSKVTTLNKAAKSYAAQNIMFGLLNT
jgi:hypothetical protein